MTTENRTSMPAIVPQQSAEQLPATVAGAPKEPKKVTPETDPVLCALAAQRDAGRLQASQAEKVLGEGSQTLSETDKQKLSEQVSDGKRMAAKAIDSLVRSHIGLAKYRARRYERMPIDIADLEGFAFEGLVKAARSFDPEKGKFISIASSIIDGTLLKGARDHHSPNGIKPPRGEYDARVAVRRAQQNFEHTSLRHPSRDEIAVASGLSVDAVARVLDDQTARSALRLDEKMFGNGEAGDYLGEIIASKDEDFTEQITTNDELQQQLAQLPPHLREVLVRRFWGEQTQTQIGEAMEYSQMHISRLQVQALDALRRSMLLDDDPSEKALGNSRVPQERKKPYRPTKRGVEKPDVKADDEPNDDLVVDGIRYLQEEIDSESEKVAPEVVYRYADEAQVQELPDRSEHRFRSGRDEM